MKTSQGKLWSGCEQRMLSGFAELGPQNVCSNQTAQWFCLWRCRLSDHRVIDSCRDLPKETSQSMIGRDPTYSISRFALYLYCISTERRCQGSQYMWFWILDWYKYIWYFADFGHIFLVGPGVIFWYLWQDDIRVLVLKANTDTKTTLFSKHYFEKYKHVFLQKSSPTLNV